MQPRAGQIYKRYSGQGEYRVEIVEAHPAINNYRVKATYCAWDKTIVGMSWLVTSEELAKYTLAGLHRNLPECF